jgi:manganese transport protein
MSPPPAAASPAAPDGVKAARPSLEGAHGSVAVPSTGGWWRRMFAFAGPGYLIAVGYMDPGNWATDLAGGSAYGYRLLSVVLASSLIAMVLQALAARLGIAAGLDLAQACRRRFRPAINVPLWLLCEIAIIACDLAEVLGTAIALQLLFGLPLIVGVCLTALDVLMILALQRYGFRKLEAAIVALLAIIGACFVFELILSRPSLTGIASGLIPSTQIVADPAMLYLAIGILGATVMPHNLYLHSATVQTRRIGTSRREKADAIRLATIDSNVALLLALFINAAILILAAATFHEAGRTDIAEIADAHHLLTPMLGGAASTVFAIALLASGQNSTVTGTLAGQIVAEGFLDLQLPVWLRRLATRLLAIVPAVVVVAVLGDRGATSLLVLSQVILSLQLPFAIVPLVIFTGDAGLMDGLATPRWLRWLAWILAVLVVTLNIALLIGLLWR